MYLQKFHQGIEHLLSAMAFVCHEYYKVFRWASFSLYLNTRASWTMSIGCRIQRDGVVLRFPNSRNDCSEDFFTHYTDKLFHYCRWQIVCVSLATTGLSFDMLCKKVAYWAMSSRTPRKFPFLGDPTNSLSPLNAKSCSAINLITLTTLFQHWSPLLL